MITLIFDTETTGKADFKNLDDPTKQPYIVQLAAALYDGREMVSHMSAIILPVDGDLVPVHISDEVAEIHGITNEIAEKVGIRCRAALSMFNQLAINADRIAAHNTPFDMAMLRAEWSRENAPRRDWESIPHICTMRSSTDVCRIPGNYGFKWPKLIEAHQHFLGEGFDGSHDAMADVQACARVLWALEDGGHPLVDLSAMDIAP